MTSIRSTKTAALLFCTCRAGSKRCAQVIEATARAIADSMSVGTLAMWDAEVFARDIAGAGRAISAFAWSVAATMGFIVGTVWEVQALNGML